MTNYAVITDKTVEMIGRTQRILLDADGGTIEQYGRRLVARQDSEIAIFTRTSNEIEQAVKGELSKSEIAELVDRRNEELRRMGIKLIPMPEIAD